ncbi:DUF4251 domain-containing protein [Aquimarina agarivorans]|uniref:DUF4251 domain-containing protein n=1 Tax=Aquimarina agarivorans TaxID=980584 RepID=UPI001EE65AF2|nr:DUF4251 domain-containing protein [Aquimarina agarivorans]
MISVASCFIACKSSRLVNSAQEKEQLAALIQLIESKKYQINIKAVYPFNTTATNQVLNTILFPTGNSAARIDVQGNGNFIKIMGDSIDADLPFFGERQISGNYGTTDNGIRVQNLMKQYTVTTNPKKNTVTAKLNANNNVENHTFIIWASNSDRVQVIVNSSHLNPISYDGTIEPIVSEDVQ